LGVRTETDDLKSADNSKHNASQNKVQPKVESSDSSSDEFVRAPSLSSFDLDKFPEKKEIEFSDFTAIENNILTGVTCLSDSEDCDFEGDSEDKSTYSPPSKRKENATESAKTGGERKKSLKSSKSRIKSKMNIAEASTGSVNMERDGMKVLVAPDVNKMNVSELLALGEGSRTISKVRTSVSDRKHDLTSDSENDLSEWENVEGLGVTPTEHIIPKEGIEVTLEMPDVYRKRKKKGFDMEAHLRRRLNRVRRELQVLIHKVHLLCWIAHGQYINSVLSSEILMAQCLSLIPSKHCYPSKHTNLNYLEQIVTWFKKTVTITESTESGPLLPVCESLQQSFQFRTAHSARDLVLMFICILRTLGVKARLIMSLQPLPLKPSNQDLCISNKTKKNNKSELKDSTCVKGEDTDIRGGSEAGTSKMSFQEVNECLKGKKPRNSTKWKDEKPVDDTYKKKDENKSNSNLKSKTRNDKLVKRNRNDADISDEKMGKLKRTLRARKEEVNMYKDKSDSSDEADTSNQDVRVVREKKGSSNIRTASDRHHHKRSATDVSLTDQQKTLSKSAESSRKIVKVKTNKKENSCQTASSIKEDEDSDSDADQSCNFKTTGSADSNSDSDFKPKKVTKKKKSSDGRLLDRGVLASDSGTCIDGEGTQKKKKNRCDFWTEVFLEEEEKWISVDVQTGKVHCIAELHVSHTFSV
jgi:xeroderma pigmentosum group C-complementing protein